MLSRKLAPPIGRRLDLPVARSRTVAQVLFESGHLHGVPLCAGAGLCGQCAVRFISAPPEPTSADCARFSTDEIDAGWRLSCRHMAVRPWQVELPELSTAPAVSTALLSPCLGVDLGTTRIKWCAGQPGLPGGEQGAINPQMAAGSEVMSRLAYAESCPSARERLHRLAVDYIGNVVSNVQASDIAISGHTAMIALLVNAPLGGLAYAPYRVPWSGGCHVSIRSGLPDVYIPPVLAPFIGADISAGLGHLCCSSDANYPFLFADLGTNGEFVLAVDEHQFWVTSVPMGPAIEGVGLLCGAPAGHGAISHFCLEPQGLQWQTDEHPTAISGTGYISLLAILRRTGLVSVDGHLGEPTSPLARRLGSCVDSQWGKTLPITDAVWLAERDVEEFLKVKAGVHVAIQALLEAANVSLHDIAVMYLAGALGEHVKARDLFTLGFLPALLDGRLSIVGNTSLAGAFRASYDREFREWLARLPRHTQLVSLVERSDFSARYIQAMRFAWHG